MEGVVDDHPRNDDPRPGCIGCRREVGGGLLGEPAPGRLMTATFKRRKLTQTALAGTLAAFLLVSFLNTPSAPDTGCVAGLEVPPFRVGPFKPSGA
jgi:hypothetical protein